MAWRGDKNPSGAAVLRGGERGAELVEVAAPLHGADVLAFIRSHLTERAVVAIDAPLIIPQPTGQRRCETLVGNRYGARHASCHSSNQTLYPNAASVHLAIELLQDGFCHAPANDGARLMLEVYPHAALVELFALEKTIKYKKGSVASKRRGLVQLQGIVSHFTTADPPVLSTPALQAFISTGLENLSGRLLKDYEDAIDGLICAYLAYYYWRWRSSRTETFGAVGTGYIVNPSCSLTP